MDSRARAALQADLTRLAEGDRSAFDEVYDALWPMVRRFAARMVGDADAEDVAQVALTKLFDRAADFDPAKDGAAWALTLTAWECRTVRRRAAQRREIPLDAPELQAGHHDPTDSLLAKRAVEEAEAVLQTLSSHGRETLRLAFADEGRGATFRKRKQRALARLRTAWRMTHG